MGTDMGVTWVLKISRMSLLRSLKRTLIVRDFDVFRSQMSYTSKMSYTHDFKFFERNGSARILSYSHDFEHRKSLTSKVSFYGHLAISHGFICIKTVYNFSYLYNWVLLHTIWMIHSHWWDTERHFRNMRIAQCRNSQNCIGLRNQLDICTQPSSDHRNCTDR